MMSESMYIYIPFHILALRVLSFQMLWLFLFEVKIIYYDYESKRMIINKMQNMLNYINDIGKKKIKRTKVDMHINTYIEYISVLPHKFDKDWIYLVM